MEQRMQILIADENAEFRKGCREQLRQFGFCRIEEATDGQDALYKINRFQPDAILIDGWLSKVESVQIIRSAKALAMNGGMQATIFLLSAANSANLIREATEAGADYVMMKPIDYRALRERLSRIAADKSAAGQPGVQNEAAAERELELEITNVIHQIGVPAHIKGYQYLRTAIMMTVKNDGIMNAVTKILYPTVAKQYGTTSSRVERAIRHAIEVAWDRGDVDVLNAYFGYTILSTRGKPTNSEFIAMIADNLRLQNKIC